MTWSKLRLDVVVLTFIVVSILAFGGQFAFYRFQVEQPTVKALKTIPGVKTARLERDAAGQRIVKVRLEAVPDFPRVYDLIVATAARRLGGGLAGIVIEDGRDDELVKTYNRMNLAVEEGIATGRFTEMASALESVARKDGLGGFDVWVDEGHVYLSLKKGNHWLYQAVGRFGKTAADPMSVTSSGAPGAGAGSTGGSGGGTGTTDPGAAVPAVSIVGGDAS